MDKSLKIATYEPSDIFCTSSREKKLLSVSSERLLGLKLAFEGLIRNGTCADAPKPNSTGLADAREMEDKAVSRLDTLSSNISSLS